MLGSLLLLASAPRLALGAAAWVEPVAGATLNLFYQEARSLRIASVADVPYVIWSEYDGFRTHVWAKRLAADGSSWVSFAGGGPVDGAATIEADAADVAALGATPIVALVRTTASDVRRLTIVRPDPDGDGWLSLADDPLINVAGYAHGPPSLAVGGDTPWVAWTEWDSSWGRVFVKRLAADGSAWVTPYPEPLNVDPAAFAEQPDLALVAGVPHVAWTERATRAARSAAVHVARMTINGWQRLGGPLNIAGTTAVTPRVAELRGIAYVGWVEGDPVTDRYDVRVARWDEADQEWTELGAAPLNDVSCFEDCSISLETIGGVLYASWGANDIFVKYLDVATGVWQEPATGPLDVGVRESEAIAPELADVAGVPHAAWLESDGSPDLIRVKRLTEPVAAPPVPSNIAILDGSQGDYILQGQTTRATETDVAARWQTVDGTPGRSVTVSAGQWTIVLSAPAGQSLEIGAYDDVRLSGEGRGCNPTGRFVVLERPILAADGGVRGLAADFEHGCEGSRANAQGVVRIGSDLPAPLLQVAPLLDFGDEIVGETTPSSRVTVANVGTSATVVTSVVRDGEMPTDFSVTADTCAEAVLEPDDACFVDVEFAPTDTLDRRAAIRVDHDAPLAARAVAVRGMGVSPLTLAPIRAEFASDPEDPIGQGGAWSYSDPPSLTVDPLQPSIVNMGFEGWSLQFVAPSGSPGLVPGDYHDTVGSGIWDPARPSLTVTGLGRGCGGSTGWFRILDPPVWEKDGRLLSFSVDFTQRCRESSGLLRGSLRYHSTLPTHLDDEPPVGTVTIAAGAEYARSTATRVSVVATDEGSTVRRVSLSNDGLSWTEFAYASTIAWTLSSVDGAKTVWVRWRDGAGNWSATKTDSIVLDTTAPTVGRPRHRFTTGSRLSLHAIPVRVTWTGSDVTSGVDRYQLALSVDGGAYVTVDNDLSSARLIAELRPSHSHRFRVRAFDEAGNRSAWAYGPSFPLSAYDDRDQVLAYGGTWRTGSGSGFWGGTTAYARGRGTSVEFHFTGRAFAWVAGTGPTRGSALVYVDGAYVTTVSLHAPTNLARQIVFSRLWQTSAAHRVRIVVSGTLDHPRVDLDAVLTMT